MDKLLGSFLPLFAARGTDTAAAIRDFERMYGATGASARRAKRRVTVARSASLSSLSAASSSSVGAPGELAGAPAANAPVVDVAVDMPAGLSRYALRCVCICTHGVSLHCGSWHLDERVRPYVLPYWS